MKQSGDEDGHRERQRDRVGQAAQDQENEGGDITAGVVPVPGQERRYPEGEGEHDGESVARDQVERVVGEKQDRQSEGEGHEVGQPSLRPAEEQSGTKQDREDGEEAVGEVVEADRLQHQLVDEAGNRDQMADMRGQHPPEIQMRAVRDPLCLVDREPAVAPVIEDQRCCDYHRDGEYCPGQPGAVLAASQAVNLFGRGVHRV